MAFLFLVFSCEKETIESSDEIYINYFEIKNDNPDDPVEKVRYEIYEKYGVPVFFNDTIAKVFVKMSPTGDSVFRYERVDMNWTYYNNTSGTYRYEYTYYTTDAEKLKALDLVRDYLEIASEPLRPYCFLATKLTSKIEIRTGGDLLGPWNTGGYEIGYRALLLQNLDAIRPVDYPLLPTKMRKMMITNKLKNYKKELDEFESASDKKWYGVYWEDPVPDGLGVVWDSSHVMKRYNSSGIYQRDEKIKLSPDRVTYQYLARDYPLESPESLESLRQNARAKMGVFGFVGYKNTSVLTYGRTQELDVFLEEILTTNREEFTRRWGTSPLVMKKYNILYEIIKEQLDIDLDSED